MPTAQEIFESNATADELAEDLLKRQQQAYNDSLKSGDENNELHVQEEKEENEETNEADNSTVEETTEDKPIEDGAETTEEKNDVLDYDNTNTDNHSNEVATSDVEQSIFDQLNKLNNPDGLEVPEGMVPYRRNGKTEFTSLEDYNSKAHMGTDYTQKMQELATGRREIEKIKKMNVSDEELAMLEVLRSGDASNIIKAVGKNYNISSESLLNNTVDLEDEHIKSFQMPDVQSQQQNITQYSDEVKAMYNVFPEESIKPINDAISMLPDSMRNLVSQNAQVLEAFAIDVNSGQAHTLIGYVNGELSKMDPFNRNLLLTDPSNYISLYSEGAKKIFAAKSPERSETNTQHVTNPNQGRTISAADREARNRLNSNTHNIQPSVNQNSTDSVQDNVSKILNEDGFVDEYIAKKYGG